jgi:hypothetical protein
MTAGEMNWCGRCHHAIVPEETAGGWAHFSSDDWAGHEECACVNRLAQCSPGKRASRKWAYAGRTSGTVMTMASGGTVSLGPGFLYSATDI